MRAAGQARYSAADDVVGPTCGGPNEIVECAPPVKHPHANTEDEARPTCGGPGDVIECRPSDLQEAARLEVRRPGKHRDQVEADMPGDNDSAGDRTSTPPSAPSLTGSPTHPCPASHRKGRERRKPRICAAFECAEADSNLHTVGLDQTLNLRVGVAQRRWSNWATRAEPIAVRVRAGHAVQPSCAGWLGLGRLPTGDHPAETTHVRRRPLPFGSAPAVARHAPPRYPLARPAWDRWE